MKIVKATTRGSMTAAKQTAQYATANRKRKVALGIGVGGSVFSLLSRDKMREEEQQPNMYNLDPKNFM